MKKAMKILTLVLFVMGMTALTSCSKGNDKLILGKWQLYSFTMSGNGYDLQMTMEEFYELMGGSAEDVEDIIIEFKSDGYVYMDEDRSPYSISGDKLMVEEVDDETGEVEYETMTITELTEKALTLENSGYIEELGSDLKLAIHFKKL